MFLNYMYTELLPLMHVKNISFASSIDPSFIILESIRTRKFLYDLKKQQRHDSFIRHKLLKDFENGLKTLNDCASILKEKKFETRYKRSFGKDIDPKDIHVFENLIKLEFETDDKDDYNIIFQKIVKFFVLDLNRTEIIINKFNTDSKKKFRRNKNVLSNEEINSLKIYAKQCNDDQIYLLLNQIYTN